MTTRIDTDFIGALPKVYDTYLLPVFFEPYAKEIVQRLNGRPFNNVLEIAAGTGIVTRYLDNALPAHVRIIATDLNQPMLD